MGTFEQRKLIRADILIKVIYKTIRKPQLEGFSFSKNISTIGINITIVDKLKKNTELEVKIYLPGQGKPVITKGKVIWQVRCSYIPNSKRQYYSTGVQFSHMLTDDAIKTSDFVKDTLTKQSDAWTQKIIKKIESKKNQ